MISPFLNIQDPLSESSWLTTQVSLSNSTCLDFRFNRQTRNSCRYHCHLPTEFVTDIRGLICLSRPVYVVLTSSCVSRNVALARINDIRRLRSFSVDMGFLVFITSSD
jgi:hypothetical protein